MPYFTIALVAAMVLAFILGVATGSAVLFEFVVGVWFFLPVVGFLECVLRMAFCAVGGNRNEG